MVQHTYGETLSFTLTKIVDEEGSKARLTLIFFIFESSSLCCLVLVLEVCLCFKFLNLQQSTFFHDI